MGKIDKLVGKLISGESDKNFDFDDLRKVLKHFGFNYRSKGSHFVFSKAGHL